MSVKLQTLEHLDGKQVRFSTITSQYPELFVKRKRNVGELIISTDLDTRYGMHHIYAGGEHIASGYGFATVKTRNDLTYIQETYNGIFKYFNDAYTYHSNAYNWLTGYVINSYQFILKEIAYNSYKNIMVDEKDNSFIINDTTYTLYAGNGTISFKKDIDKFIRLTSPTNYYLQKTFLDFNKDNISDVKYNIIENKFAKYIAFAKLKIYIDRTAIGGDPDKLYYRFVYDTGIDEKSESLTPEQKNIIDTLNNGINDAHGNKWTLYTIDDILHKLIKGKLNTDSFIQTIQDIEIPIFFGNNVRLTLFIYNSFEDYVDNKSAIKSSEITFKWVNPILYKNIVKQKTNKFITSNAISQMNIILGDFTNSNSYITNTLFNVENNSYNCFLMDSSTQPMFYISSDLKNRENNEGGMIKYTTNNNMKDMFDIDGMTDSLKTAFEKDIEHYALYLSDIQTMNYTLRYDIDFK